MKREKGKGKGGERERERERAHICFMFIGNLYVFMDWEIDAFKNTMIYMNRMDAQNQVVTYCDAF